jgi:hypothetical protein
MRTKKIIWIVFALLLGAGIFWWTSIKKKVVKNAVTNAVQKKTDSLYRISYDTSEIDEINGNAYLYNVRVKLDTLQWLKLLEKDSMPPVTLDLQIAKITIKGLAAVKLLSNSSLDVTSIIIEKPVFRLERWTRKKPVKDKLNDTLEIYQRLVGNFDFLKAKNIQVVDGDFTMVDRTRKDSVAAKGINIDIDNFLVDSLHNYRNVLSYFVKQTRLTMKSFTGNTVKTGGVVYDSKQHIIHVENLSIPAKAGNAFSVKSVEVVGLSTESFIYSGLLNARKVLVKEPVVTIRSSGKKKEGLPAILSAGSIDFFMIQKGNFTVYTKKRTTISINGVDLLLKDIQVKNGRLAIEDYLRPGNYSFGIALVKLPMGFHVAKLQKITSDGLGLIKIVEVQLRPTFIRKELKTRIGKQADMYTMSMNNIVIEKIDLQKLARNNTLNIEGVTLQMNLHVFNDKTIPLDSVKRATGKFPYEGLQKAKMAIDIRTVHIKNSRIAYEEKAPKSGLNGTVFFTDLNSTVTNITNTAEKLAKDNVMKITATTNVMGSMALHSEWSLPLNVTDGRFRVTGGLAPFPITVLNPAFEPLSMSTIRSGFAEQLDFEINGNHEGSTGTELFNYRDLKIDILKKNDEDSLEKKGFISFLANAAIKNNNHSQKSKEYKFTKDRYKSMFNLLWKSVFEGAKNTVLIVK